MCSTICARVIPQASAGPSLCIVFNIHWSLQDCALIVFYVVPYAVMYMLSLVYMSHLSSAPGANMMVHDGQRALLVLMVSFWTFLLIPL